MWFLQHERSTVTIGSYFFYSSFEQVNGTALGIASLSVTKLLLE